MTVCVAASCDGGKRVVAATDGLLSFAGIAAPTMPAKMHWHNDWLSMYAGDPSNTKMIFEELFWVANGQPLTRENIQTHLLEAYKRRRAHLASFNALGPYNLSIDEFTRNGTKTFTPEEFNRLSAEIYERDRIFAEQLLVIGWGKAEAATMLYEVGPYGTQDHALTGIAAIGSGSAVALSTLLLLGQSRESSLGETLYAVAAAKFSAELSQDRDVGEHTAMYVTWKRGQTETKDDPIGEFLPNDEVKKLRNIWEDHGKPKIPEEAFAAMAGITKSIGITDTVSWRRMRDVFKQSASIMEEQEQ